MIWIIDMVLWHGLSPLDFDERGIEVGRTPGAAIGFNRIELFE